MYGSDGIYRPDLNTSVNESDPNVLNGMTLFVASAPGSDAYDSFNIRLENALEQEGNLAFGAQSYDCTIILALAAREAGSTDGDDIIAAVAAVTGGGGRECTSYADCAEGIDDGDDIAYVGKVGRLKLDAGGDPTVATYTVSRFEGGELVEQSTQVFDFSE